MMDLGWSAEFLRAEDGVDGVHVGGLCVGRSNRESRTVATRDKTDVELSTFVSTSSLLALSSTVTRLPITIPRHLYQLQSPFYKILINSVVSCTSASRRIRTNSTPTPSSPASADALNHRPPTTTPSPRCPLFSHSLYRPKFASRHASLWWNQDCSAQAGPAVRLIEC
jgi:hypothetical protein